MDSSIYQFCVDHCVWCRERWPLIEHAGHIKHVAPYTKNPSAFSVICAVSSLRDGLRYLEYEHGPKHSWKIHKPSDLLKYNYQNPKTRAFWRHAEKCVLDVAGWPEWKRGHPLDLKQVASARRTLLVMDEFDFFQNNHYCNGTYEPLMIDGRIAVPKCLHGLGCQGCWDKYETFQNRWDKEHPCAY